MKYYFNYSRKKHLKLKVQWKTVTRTTLFLLIFRFLYFSWSKKAYFFENTRKKAVFVKVICHDFMLRSGKQEKQHKFRQWIRSLFNDLQNGSMKLRLKGVQFFTPVSNEKEPTSELRSPLRSIGCWGRV